jgi:hypothetical protein
MLYAWPIDVDPTIANRALEVAMNYLELTGHAEPYAEKQQQAASAIVKAWQAGARHLIRLGNCGIVAVERKRGPDPLLSLYPRVC